MDREGVAGIRADHGNPLFFPHNPNRVRRTPGSTIGGILVADVGGHVDLLNDGARQVLRRVNDEASGDDGDNQAKQDGHGEETIVPDPFSCRHTW